MMHTIVNSDELLLEAVKLRAPQLTEKSLASIAAAPDTKSFWGPGTLVRGTAHKYRIVRGVDDLLHIYRVATYPTYDTPFSDDNAAAMEAAAAGAVFWPQTTAAISGVFRVLLVAAGSHTVLRTLGVGLCRSHASLADHAHSYQPQRYDDAIVAVTLREHEIYELVGSRSVPDDKAIYYYCSVCAAVAGGRVCSTCHTQRSPHSVYVGGHLPMTPRIAESLEKMGHKFSRDPLLPYMQGMRDWADEYIYRSVNLTDAPRRCVKLC